MYMKFRNPIEGIMVIPIANGNIINFRTNIQHSIDCQFKLKTYPLIIVENLNHLLYVIMKLLVSILHYLRGLALLSHVLVVGSREKEEKERNLQILFRCMKAMPILSLDY